LACPTVVRFRAAATQQTVMQLTVMQQTVMQQTVMQLTVMQPMMRVTPRDSCIHRTGSH
jgi:hypothetical protein